MPMIVERSFLNKEWGNQLTYVFRSEEKQAKFVALITSVRLRG